MIIEFLGTLNQPYTIRIGWEISLALSLEERYILVLEGVVRIAVLLLRCSDPSRQLAPYGYILHDKLSRIKARGYDDATTYTREITIFSHQCVGADDSCCSRQ